MVWGRDQIDRSDGRRQCDLGLGGERPRHEASATSAGERTAVALTIGVLGCTVGVVFDERARAAHVANPSLDSGAYEIRKARNQAACGEHQARDE